MSNRKSKTETPSLREASNRIKYKNSISKIIKYKDGYNKLINIIQNHLNKSDENINNVDINRVVNIQTKYLFVMSLSRMFKKNFISTSALNQTIKK